MFILVFILCFTAVVAVGVWYGLEGYEVIGPLLLDRRARADPGDGLPTLYLEIAPDAYQVMYRQWHESLSTGILRLEESEWVQGQIRFGGRTFPASMWLQEEAPEHWQENKWSLQVRIADQADSRQPATILGLRSFVARSPATGRYLDEWLYCEDLRRAGVLAPRYTFAHLWMNGDDWGIYALQETLSDAFLASQERPVGISLRVDDSLFGRQQAWPTGALLSSGGWAESGEQPGLVRADEDMASAIARDPALQEQYAAAVGLLVAFQRGQLAPSQAFDAGQVGRYIAHAQWWGARYGTRFVEERYYYNALTSRLEPIGGDALPLEGAYVHLPGLAQYGDLEVMEAYVAEVERISQPGYIDSLRAAYQDSLVRYQTALAREFQASELAAPWQMLSERQAILLRSLHPRETVHAYTSSQGSTTSVNVHVANLSTYPVLLDEVRAGGRTAKVQREWIADGQDALLDVGTASAVVLKPRQGAIPRYTTLYLPQSVQDGPLSRDVLSGEPLQVATHVAGRAEPVVVDIQRKDLSAPYAPAIPVRPTVEQALAQHAFLDAGERPGFLELRPGDWNVTGDLVLPEGYGLLAFQPVLLRFDAGAVLLSSGPLLLYGSEEGEIGLVPKEEDWAGIVVLDAGDEIPSSLSYVTIRATAGARRDGWHVPGGVTFYRSPVKLSHCRLIDTIAPVALYIAHARFECEQSEFGRVSAQALRSEYAEGRVTGCRFHDVLGHAIETRGSEVEVQDISMLRVYDQGISAGQNSVISVQGGYAEDAGIAVASRDASHVSLHGMLIKRAWTAGLAAYRSGPGYGPASVHASGVTFESEDAVKTLVQSGNSVRLEGMAADARELDLNRLSWRQEITAAIRPLSYNLGPAIWLAGYDVVARDIAAGEPLQVTLYWHTIAALGRDYTVFIHILDAAGETVTGWDTMPRENTLPTTQWPTDQVIDDRHIVPLDIPSGEYRIALGMYDLANGQRLPVYGPDGEAVGGDAILLDLSFRVKE